MHAAHAEVSSRDDLCRRLLSIFGIPVARAARRT